jgi:hypothetical protein
VREGHQCYHCKQWVEPGEPHDCWTTTEAALTSDLSEDLRDAWERLRESAASLGDQRIYASHHSIMFSRRACYFFVRPKRHYLELCIFLERPLKAPQIHRAMPSSKTKFANLLRIVHRDQVEPPVTDWIAEAFDYVERPRSVTHSARGGRGTKAQAQVNVRKTQTPKRAAAPRATRKSTSARASSRSKRTR